MVDTCYSAIRCCAVSLLTFSLLSINGSFCFDFFQFRYDGARMYNISTWMAHSSICCATFPCTGNCGVSGAHQYWSATLYHILDGFMHCTPMILFSRSVAGRHCISYLPSIHVSSAWLLSNASSLFVYFFFRYSLL